MRMGCLRMLLWLTLRVHFTWRLRFGGPAFTPLTAGTAWLWAGWAPSPIAPERPSSLPSSTRACPCTCAWLQAMLFDLWRWRRLGGGQDSEQMPHQVGCLGAHLRVGASATSAPHFNGGVKSSEVRLGYIAFTCWIQIHQTRAVELKPRRPATCTKRV